MTVSAAETQLAIGSTYFRVRTERFGKLSELGKKQDMSVFLRKLLLGAALITGASMTSGCVGGGAGSYFDTFSIQPDLTNAATMPDSSERTGSETAGEPMDLASAAEASTEQEPHATGSQSASMLYANAGANQFDPEMTNAAGASGTASAAADRQDTVDLMALQAEETPPGVSQEFSAGRQPQDTSGVPTEIAQTPDGALQLITPRNDSTLALRVAAGQQMASLPGTMSPNGGFVMGSEGATPIDPMEYAAEQRIPALYASIDHGQCKGGWGPKPRKINATDIRPDDNYYIEIRMRHTPMLPVGHTYVAYGRLGPNGQPIDEKLVMLAPVGGYAGAALASGIPMPSVLKPHRDDCRIRPVAAYRVSLDAPRYEQLLREIAAAKREKPKYLLFTYNCNHFMSRIAASVGIKPPDNIYVPALEYIYAMIERNEGRRISRL
jgi:hypothetical protein